MVFSFTMNTWNQTPLFRLLPFFIAGIILYLFADMPGQPAGVLALCILLPSMLLAAFLFRSHRPYRQRWFFGLGVYVFSFLGGWLLTALHSEISRPKHFTGGFFQAFTCKVIESPVIKDRSVMALVEITSGKDS